MTEESGNIPQEDLDLAREIGENLESDGSVSQMNNSLVNSIMEFRRNETYVIIPELISSKKDCWNQIEANMVKQSQHIDSAGIEHSLPQRTSVILKAAAGLLLVAMASLIIYSVTQFSESELIASTENQMTQIELREGGQVDIRPRSELYSLEQTDRVSRYRISGEAYFQVTSNPNRNFIVEAGNARIEVTGTAFNIRNWSDSTVVYLEKGGLKVQPVNSGSATDLQAGSYVVVTDTGSISEPKTANGERFTAWRQNEIYLEKRAVSSVLHELEHHFNITINVPATIQSDTLGGSISLQNPENSLQSLGVVLGGKFIETEKSVYEFAKNTTSE
jgi:transmembrane sensor